MKRTAELIQVFEDLQEYIRNDEALNCATEEACGQARCYGEEFVSVKRNVKSEGHNVLVTEGTSFQCAQACSNGQDKIAVLNFANPFEPGGGVTRGARAQEESLCRCSNLYSTLNTEKMKKEYYDVHNADKNSFLFSDRIIYSPGIIVLNDDSTYDRFPDPFRVDVITCAAPYNTFGHDDTVLRSVYEKRLTNIFEVAMANDVDILILGAFGCGAFRNPPELMADAFNRLIQSKYYAYFKKICFPLIKSAFNRNFEVFAEIIEAQ